MTVATQELRQDWAHRGLRACCVLAQALQFCLRLGMAEGPQSPWEPALRTGVLFFVGRVEPAHAEWAEEAAFHPGVALHQGLQAGELCRQVLGRKVLSIGPLPHSSCTPSLLWSPIMCLPFRKQGDKFRKGEGAVTVLPVTASSLCPAWPALRQLVQLAAV